MGTNELGWRGPLRVAAYFVGAILLASCSSDPVTPAPVAMRGAVLGVGDMAEPLPNAAPYRASAPVRRDAGYVTVRPGQSLGGIAHSYHVSEREIIAANHLTPPYKIEAGARLRIPGAGATPPEPAAVHIAAVPPAHPEYLPVAHAPEVIPLDAPLPARTAAAPAPASPAAASVAAEVAREAERDGGHPGPKPAALPERTVEAAPQRQMHGGRFPWPVQGRVLSNYGSSAGGARNDGINIAAARGTPIKSVEGGVVAYAGNELRGYGNLVLVKHPDGLISAYAHCDELLVKKGEQIRGGQVIGRVGASGGVAEPQLHFELRRGKQPVDPRELLGPGPSAGTADGAHG